MRDVTLRAGVRPWPFETVTLERTLRWAESDAWHSDQRDGFVVVQVAGLDKSAESGLGDLAPTREETEYAVHVQEGQTGFQTGKRAKASPTPGFRALAESCADGIQSHIPVGFLQVLVRDDMHGTETSPKEVPASPVLPIEPLRVRAAEMLHPA